jgi:hypothetical protein
MVSIVSIGGERVAVAGDLAVSDFVEEVVEDAGIVEIEERIQLAPGGSDEKIKSSASGWIVCPDPSYPTGWENRLISTTGGITEIDLYELFELPLETTLVDVRVVISDSGSAGCGGCKFSLHSGPIGAECFILSVGGQPNNTQVGLKSSLNPVPVTGGRIYYTAVASGANTMTVDLQLMSYYVPANVELINADMLGGLYPKESGADAHIVVTDKNGNLPASDWATIKGPYWKDGPIDLYVVEHSDDEYQNFAIGTKVWLRYSNASGVEYDRYYTVLEVRPNYADGYILSLSDGPNGILPSDNLLSVSFSHAQNPRGFPMWLAPSSDWQEVDPTGAAYISPTSFSIVGTWQLDRFPKGTKIRVAQSGQEPPVAYQYVHVVGTSTSANNIILTVAGDALPNSSYSQIAFSHAETPTGFPLHLIPSHDWIEITGAIYQTSSSIWFPGTTRTAEFSKGTKIRIKQSGTYKYFYVKSYATATGTTLQLTGGSNYTVANVAIQELSYSHMETPTGFPEWFDFTPVWTAATTNPVLGAGTIVGQFKLQGSFLTYQFRLACGSGTTFGSGNYSFSLPVPPLNDGDIPWFGQARLRRPGSWNYLFTVHVNPSDTAITWFFPTHLGGQNNSNISGTYPVAWGTSDRLEVQVAYRI